MGADIPSTTEATYLKDVLAMNTAARLKKYFVGEGKMVGEEEIHVLVKLPLEPLPPQLPMPLFYIVDGKRFDMTPNLELNPSNLVSFWHSLKQLPQEILENTLLSLPNQEKFPSGETNVFIRPCYTKLLKLTWDLINGENSHLVILGSPGIGKTFFGFVLLHQLAHLNLTVVYEHGPSKNRYLFTQTNVFKGSLNDFDLIVDNESTFYLIDGNRPKQTTGKAILLTSPRKKIYGEFKKFKCNKRYMPVWSNDEILKCHALAYNHLDKVAVERCFVRWGGIASYVLDAANIVKQEDLEKAIAAVVDIGYLRTACGQLDLHEKNACHRLMHIRVKEDFTSDYFVFASDYVADAIIQRLAQFDLGKLQNYLAISYSDPTHAVYRGHLFESYAHCVLSKGGEFRVRPLSVSGNDMEQPFKLRLPALNRKSFWSKSINGVITSSTENDYLKPLEKIFESVDAIVKPNLLFQMTCSQTHPCKQNGLHNVLNLLNNPEDPCLYFVVPPDQFNNFRYQNYTTAKDQDSKNIFQNVKRITQFVLEIDLALDSAKRRAGQMFDNPNLKRLHLDGPVHEH
ncbi:crinkler (CRN) family protein [Thraustotheca clavata]|uniref:Crinkler (CRN) family protein n=1 Tax=Thraustotheca clavata TaxID=74557 RepID=A0A1V9ZDM4_9STRA|nr:crinkler (CRN) family protein [Thraustotheca clavata]